MDLFPGSSPDNYNEVRGRSFLTNEHIFRNLLMSSTKSSVVYYNRMERNNTIVIDKEMVDTSSGLSHRTEQEKILYVSKAAEQQDNMRSKYDNLKASNFNPQYVLNKE